MTKGNPKWEQFEHYVQDLLGLRSTAGSGNQWHDVSDGVSPPEDPYKIMVDCKFTEHASYSLNGRVLQEWWNKATGAGYHFALPVRLQGAMGGPARILEWATIPLDDYAELVDYARSLLSLAKRCCVLPPDRGDRVCCRRPGHFGNHDNGEIEWSG